MPIMHLAAASGFHGALRPWVEADAEKRERARYLYALEYVFGRKS
jgi:hypothetical protein